MSQVKCERGHDRIRGKHCGECRTLLRRSYGVDYVRRANRRANLRRYGISPGEFDAQRARQGNTCLICQTQMTDPAPLSGTSAVIDHCKGPDRRVFVRGILCARCNVGIGMLGDCPDALRTAAAYIERANYVVWGRRAI